VGSGWQPAWPRQSGARPKRSSPVVMVLVPEKKNMPMVISCRLRMTPGCHRACRPVTREGAAAVAVGSSRLISTP